MTYDPHNIDQLNRSEPAYLAAYGLTEAPFSSQQDDRFLYLNAALTERLELLKHYTQYGNLLLIISGERGIGKSSLKQRFINTALEEWKICQIQAHTMMDASLLLKQVAHGFGITEAPFEPSALYEVLSAQLEHLHQKSYEPILIIDDAHELPQDALQSLLYLAEHHSDHQTALRIILFCEPEIETMLEDPAIHSLKERVTHSMEIPRLDETQTAEYLRHRLAVAGLDGTSPFTPKLIHKIYKASDGIPSHINEYAHQNLLDDREPVTNEEMDLDDELMSSATQFTFRNMILGGAALAIVVAVLLFQNRINSLFEEAEEVVTQAELIQKDKKPTEITQDEKTTVTTPPESNKEKTIEFTLNKKPEPISESVSSKVIENESTAKVEQQASPDINTLKDNTKKSVLHLTSVNPSPVLPSKQRQIISISGKGFHKRQQVKVSWTGNEKILSDTQVNVTSKSYMNLILSVGTQSDTWTITVTDPLLNIESNSISFNVVAAEKETTLVTKTKPLTKIQTKKHDGIYDQSWIKQQNKNNFTLQLLATHQKGTLPNYLKKFSLKDDAAIFINKRDGQDWFTLIYGSYTTKSAAQVAAKKLPKGVSKPWVRSFASIHPLLAKEIIATTSTTKKTTNKTVLVPASNIPADQEGWLWSQDPRNFTLQLAAGTDKKAIQYFIKRHQLTGKAVYFHRIRDGKDWYILVYGSYTGYSKAKHAISQLPESVQKAKPWARSFSAIHAELN